MREGRGHRLLAFSEILLCTAEEGVTYAHTTERQYLTDYTLTELEERAGERFFRSSRSALVNLDRVQKIESAGDGSAALTLADGGRVRVARRRTAELRHRLEER